MKQFKVEAYISRIALEKRKKDKYIQSNKKKYNSIILRIISVAEETGNPKKYPTETISKFLISPRGGIKERIVWHFGIKDDGTILIYIDDLLYHIKEDEYSGNWISQRSKGKIGMDNYSEGDYANFNGL